MSQPIFPVEITEHSVEQHWAEHSTRSQIIYLLLVATVLIAAASLPFIYVDVNVQSGGLVRPVAEKTEVKSPTTGKVVEVLVKDNQAVRKGQPLLAIQTDLLDQQLTFNDQRTQELQGYRRDLVQLTQANLLDDQSNLRLATDLYAQAFREFRQRAAEIQTRIAQAQTSYDRATVLAQKEVIARKEVEERKLALNMAQAELKSLVAQHRNQWQGSLRQHHNDLTELNTDRQRIEKEKEQFHLVAPENGTLQNLSGIYPGSYVFANQIIAELSPDSLLIVESYVTPSDIGFLRTAMPVTFQVDAFNYNEWGTATGHISSISSDVTILNEQPVFKVRSTLDRTYLTLQNGYQGNLKKGMTVHARFRVNERSVYQLLYDKVDNWLNPNANDPIASR